MLVGVGLETFVAGAMIAQLTAGMATRDALFLSYFGPNALPYVMGLSAVLSVVVVTVFSRLLARWSPDRVVPAAFALNAALFVAEWALTPIAPAPIAVMTYLHTMILGAVLVSGFWTLLTERFDPHTAKRVFGRIGAGASLGGVLGGLAAAQAGAFVSITTMLPLLAVLNLACAAGLRGLPRRTGTPVAPATAETVGGFTLPYLRHLAVFVVVAAIADATLDYVFKASAAQHVASADRMEFFALFYAFAGGVSFLLQALLARRLLRNVGLATTLATQPIIVACGTVVAVFVPGLWSASLLRGGDSALRNSLFKSSYELLYTPLRPAHKRAVKPAIDVGFSRLGGFAGSALVLAAITFVPSAAPSLLLWVAAAACVISLLLVAILHRGYVTALADSLRSAAIRLDPDDVEDATTRKTLAMTTRGLDHAVLQQQIAALRQPLPEPALSDELVGRATVLRSGEVEPIRETLATELDPALVTFAMPLLARAELVEDTTRALRKIAPRITGQLVDALLDPNTPRLVRRRIPRVLVASVTQRAVDGLVLGLRADHFDIRHRCAIALERLTDRGSTLVIERGPVLEAVRTETKQLGTSHEHLRLDQIFVLLGLVLDRQPLKLAYRALASADPALRGTGLEYIENVMPPEVRDGLKQHLGLSKPTQRPPEAIAKVLLASMPAFDPTQAPLDDEPS